MAVSKCICSFISWRSLRRSSAQASASAASLSSESCVLVSDRTSLRWWSSGTASSHWSTAASATSHTSSSSHWCPLEVRTVEFLRRTSHGRRTHRSLSTRSAALSHRRVWRSVSSVHHTVRPTHWWLSHHWPLWVKVAWEASLVSARRRVLIVRFASSSHLRVHHSLSLIVSWARTVSAVARLAVVERIRRVMHWIVARVWSHVMRAPIASLIVVRSAWPSLLLPGLSQLEIIVASVRVRRNELPVSVWRIVLAHWHHASVGTTAVVHPLIRMRIVVSLARIGSAATKSSSYLEVSLLRPALHVSALVSVLIVLDGIGLEPLLPRPALIVSGRARTIARITAVLMVSFLVASSSFLLLVLVLWTFNILFILFVLVGFWVVPTLFLLFLIAIFVLVLALLVTFGVESVVLLGALMAFFGPIALLRLFGLLFGCRRARCLLLFRNWFLIAWIRLVERIF